MNQGPLSICVDASNWMHYSGGTTGNGVVLTCGKNVNYCAQIVGVNTDSSTSNGGNGFWKVRASLGDDWGSMGHVYLALGMNTCSVASDPHYTEPVLIDPDE